MPNDVERFEEWASRPFQPCRLRRNDAELDVGERVVEALEYIAAQLGEIARKLDHTNAGLRPSQQDIDEMKDLLRKL